MLFQNKQISRLRKQKIPQPALFTPSHLSLAPSPAQVEELGALRARLSTFESRLDGCTASLSSVQAQTAVLPQMHAALKALVDAHSPSA